MLKDFTLLDLTHTLDESIPTWTGECGFRKKRVSNYTDGACVMEYHCTGGPGTHIDAPSHFIPGARDVDGLTLEELFAPLCLIEMTQELRPEAQITLEDLQRFEREHGPIQKGSVVVGHTGWSRHWKNPEVYRGREPKRPFPSFHPDVGAFLLERDVAGIGIDTLSPDPFGGSYPLHRALLGADKFILENLTQLEKVPQAGSFLIALPLKITSGTESPVRAIALIPRA